MSLIALHLLLACLFFGTLPSASSFTLSPDYASDSNVYLNSKLYLKKESFPTSRRDWIRQSALPIVGLLLSTTTNSPAARAEEGDFLDDPEIQELYNNPNLPQAPEERSGLVVLRVAEVAQFQEKILRTIVSGEAKDLQVAPMQFVFGNQILLKNSNLAGNLKLMIDEEIPRRNRNAAVQNAVVVMNTLQEITKYAASIERDFEPEEMVELANMYRTVRVNLNQLYEYLPQKEKDKYYGYFVAVTEYEKKIAEGTYNPDLDGVLKFDD